MASKRLTRSLNMASNMVHEAPGPLQDGSKWPWSLPKDNLRGMDALACWKKSV